MLPLTQNTARTCPPLNQIVLQIDEISTLPHIAMRIMEVLTTANTAATDIRQVMEADPALSARVLRCVNSSAYGLRSKITNLQQAIVYLGLKQIRNLAMAASVSEMFKKASNIGPYRRLNLWKHLVSVGICARSIAMRLGFLNFEDMFLAGLLHDIGVVLEDQHLHQYFELMVRNLDVFKTLSENEQEALGFDHTQLGAAVATKWKFPQEICDPIRHHHHSHEYHAEDENIVRCVAVADIICSLKDITPMGTKLGKDSSLPIQQLGLGKDDLIVLSQDLDRELEKNALLLKIGGDSDDKNG
ncbi:MAG: HDOD domain-containing protein [Thermoguttaceae bacterium]